ncbi:MAG: lysophospholipid acyltransferase family protein [Alphaproteobacteria bacterium]|nr:lysophospholipid acyltransferase family protein [Alphaproteobacteria bacterium]
MTVRGLFFGVYFYAFTVATVIVIIPSILLPRPLFLAACRFWLNGVMVGLRVFGGVRWEWRGVESLPPRPFILACKHQSTWETLALNAPLDFPAFVLKKELSEIPLFGRYLKAIGEIAIDRDAGASALKMLIQQTRAALEQGRIVVIFPEGTRTAPGQGLRYHPGVAAIYSDSAAPVVPAALNSGLCWPKSIWRVRPGRIVFSYLPAIPPGLTRREFMTRLETAIETESAALNQA